MRVYPPRGTLEAQPRSCNTSFQLLLLCFPCAHALKQITCTYIRMRLDGNGARQVFCPDEAQTNVEVWLGQELQM